ncbi:unnamed protein product [Mesocestoides corti]|uniref:Leukocyte surface antigen CD53-like n=1 Tax=Mesocestoides corti TaxID=53468 RepID=A0A0R3UQG8_MESCO|nr:unnamed protein product [Mesocestoides corti]
MTLSCSGTVLKIFIFTISIIIIIIGALCGIFGCYILGTSLQVKTTMLIGPFAFGTATGLLVLIVGFLGFLGALHESNCMIRTFAVCAAVLLVAELIVAILVFISQGQGCSFALFELFKTHFLAEGILSILLCPFLLGAMFCACLFTKSDGPTADA